MQELTFSHHHIVSQTWYCQSICVSLCSLWERETSLVSFIGRVYGEDVWGSTSSLTVFQPASRGARTVIPEQPSSLNSNSIMRSSEKGNHDLSYKFLCLYLSFYLIVLPALFLTAFARVSILFCYCLHVTTEEQCRSDKWATSPGRLGQGPFPKDLWILFLDNETQRRRLMGSLPRNLWPGTGPGT